MLSFQIRMNCEKSKIEKQKTQDFLVILTTDYVIISTEFIYFVNKLILL